MLITGLKIGQGGYAYVVDGRGRLIAHPDISLDLQDTDFLHLPQVAAALHRAPGSNTGSDVTVATNTTGASVLSAHAAIAPLGWLVFVEVPLQEAYAPLYGAGIRSTVLLILGLAGATLAALLLARRMTGPVRELQEGAARIGAGTLDRRIDIHTGDELEGLADQFNRMAGDLETSYAELEHRVEERTAELAEALDQQTATAEVLGVINASPGELAPVFDAMLEKAMRLCEADFGSFVVFDGENRFRAVVHRNVPDELVEALRAPVRSTRGGAFERLINGENILQIVDLAENEAQRGDPSERTMVGRNDERTVVWVAKGGARTAVWVALRRDDSLLGALVIYRQEVRPFTDKQIALLQNFAAQAVIAMENARLITETQEALDQQTATAEVLGVITASPGDLPLVFDAMLEKALRLVRGGFRDVLFQYDGRSDAYGRESRRQRRGGSEAFRDMGARCQRRADSRRISTSLAGVLALPIRTSPMRPTPRPFAAVSSTRSKNGRNDRLAERIHGVALRKRRHRCLACSSLYRTRVFGRSPTSRSLCSQNPPAVTDENARLTPDARGARPQTRRRGPASQLVAHDRSRCDAMLDRAVRLRSPYRALVPV